MKIRLLFLLVAMLAPAIAAAEYVEIWSYAFITRTDEPISGNSGAIFKPKGDGLSAPLYSQSRETYQLIFSVHGSSAKGTLTAPTGSSIELTGTIRHSSNSDGGCFIQVHLANDIHQVVLEHVTLTACAP